MVNLDAFSGPGEFAKVVGQRVGVSTIFCHCVSTLMQNRKLTFGQACRMMETAGILFWAGDCPLIDMKRADFCMRKSGTET